jgi:hypothetical protein
MKLSFFSFQGKVIKFKNSGLLINFEILHNYLISDESIFEAKVPIDFYESLQVLQFSRSVHTKEKLAYLFINPNFQEDSDVPDDFYKMPIDIMSFNMLKGTKRMSNNHHIGIFERLLKKKERSEMQLSMLEVSRLRVKFDLQRKLDLKSVEECLIEHELREPEYVKNNEIAGYYGLVKLDDLKLAFRNYFPMYQESEKHPVIEIENVQSTPQETVAVAVDDPVVTIVDMSDENKENEPPKKKYRRNKTSKIITQRETNDALMSLEMEICAIDKIN